jgi:hypothetical protein
MENKVPTTDIMVFTFAKDSQINFIDENKDAYLFVYQILSRLLEEHNSEVSKIGLGGYLHDVSAYISYIIASYDSHRRFLNMEESTYDTSDFDPESEPG